MDDILRIKISRSIQTLILLSLHGWNSFALAPQGCLYEDGIADCNFQEWNPPLRDGDFGPEPLYGLSLNKIHGNIPAGAFSGLNAPDTKNRTYIELYCKPGNTRLSQDIFTPNLHWVMDLSITHCKLVNGLPSRLLKNLKSLQKLKIWRDTIDGLVAHDTLAELTNLQEIAFRGTFESGELPSRFFGGLKNLIMIRIELTNLNFIPPSWFNGLVSLEKIYLPLNDIHTLPLGLFDELRSLTYVLLDNNPWNCSCEIVWLLDWSNITVGGKCTDPLAMNGMELEDALPLLNCTGSSPIVLTEALSPPPEVSDTWTWSSPDFAVPSKRYLAKTTLTSSSGSVKSGIATSSHKELAALSSTHTQKTARPPKSTTNPMMVTTTYKPKTATVAATINTPAAMPISTISLPVLTADDIRTTKLFMSSIASAISEIVPTSHFTSTKDSSSLNGANGSDGAVNNLQSIGFISAGGALIVLLVIAAVFYRWVGRNRLCRVANSDDGR